MGDLVRQVEVPGIGGRALARLETMVEAKRSNVMEIAQILWEVRAATGWRPRHTLSGKLKTFLSTVTTRVQAIVDADQLALAEPLEVLSRAHGQEAEAIANMLSCICSNHEVSKASVLLFGGISHLVRVFGSDAPEDERAVGCSIEALASVSHNNEGVKDAVVEANVMRRLAALLERNPASGR